MNIWFASNNIHKKSELEAILNISLKIPSEAGIKFDPDETGITFCENALIKARDLKNLLGNDDPVIADDSGLCVDALGGRPGVLSARYGFSDEKKLTSEGQNLLLLDELGESPNRSARFVCAMVLLFDNDRFFISQETLEGEIVKTGGMRGDGGFGYDPVFLLGQFNKTLSEISADEKNRISHRGKAAARIAYFLENFLI